MSITTPTQDPVNELGRIAFIGGGNMARSIIGGLIKQGHSNTHIAASDPSEAAIEQLELDFGIPTSTDNHVVAKEADVIVLAVKPQVMSAVCKQLVPAIKPETLIISIAAGINCASLSSWLGPNSPIVRCMPNTPALLSLGASGLFANNKVTQQQRFCAEAILRAVGLVEWVDDEKLIDAVTAVSGSGPAYFFYVLEAMTKEGVAQGLSPTVAENLAKQTALGAAQLALQSDVSLAELRKRVTSPGGTTEQAIMSFERDDLPKVISRAMKACANRAVELADELGKA